MLVSGTGAAGGQAVLMFGGSGGIVGSAAGGVDRAKHPLRHASSRIGKPRVMGNLPFDDRLERGTAALERGEAGSEPGVDRAEPGGHRGLDAAQQLRGLRRGAGVGQSRFVACAPVAALIEEPDREGQTGEQQQVRPVAAEQRQSQRRHQRGSGAAPAAAGPGSSAPVIAAPIASQL